MPLMPEPPIPTKWMRLTLCFIRRPFRGSFCYLHAAARDETCSVGLAQRARLLRHLQELRAIERADQRGELCRRHLALQDQDRGALAGEEAGVGALVIVDRVRER